MQQKITTVTFPLTITIVEVLTTQHNIVQYCLIAFFSIDFLCPLCNNDVIVVFMMIAELHSCHCRVPETREKEKQHGSS